MCRLCVCVDFVSSNIIYYWSSKFLSFIQSMSTVKCLLTFLVGNLVSFFIFAYGYIKCLMSCDVIGFSFDTHIHKPYTRRHAHINIYLYRIKFMPSFILLAWIEKTDFKCALNTHTRNPKRRKRKDFIRIGIEKRTTDNAHESNRRVTRHQIECDRFKTIYFYVNENGFQSGKYLLRLGFGHRSSISLPHTHSHIKIGRPKICTQKKAISLMLNSLDQIDYGFLEFFFSLLFLNTTSYIIVVNWWRPEKSERKKGRKTERKKIGPITSMRHILTWFIDCNNICHTSYNQTVLHDNDIWRRGSRTCC